MGIQDRHFKSESSCVGVEVYFEKLVNKMYNNKINNLPKVNNKTTHNKIEKGLTIVTHGIIFCS